MQQSGMDVIQKVFCNEIQKSIQHAGSLFGFWWQVLNQNAADSLGCVNRVCLTLGFIDWELPFLVGSCCLTPLSLLLHSWSLEQFFGLQTHTHTPFFLKQIKVNKTKTKCSPISPAEYIYVSFLCQEVRVIF